MRRRSRLKPLLALTMGDPAGIGPEVIVKAVARGAVGKIARPICIGSVSVMERTVRSLNLPLRIVPVAGHERPDSGSPGDVLPVLDPLTKPLGRFRMGVVGEATGRASVQCIERAVQLALDGCVDGIVTAPINKEGMHLAGYRYPGHTEFLAALTGAKEVGMMILGGPLKIMFTTTHAALREVPDLLNAQRVGRAIRLAARAMREYFHVPSPSIGVAALNPHAGEGGLFGTEERTVIQPAVRRAKASGIRASDPQPADTLFGKAARGDYDVVVAMYHDQGLIPLKLVAFGRCVNLTVGLPILRTSVDHGTAYDLAGKGRADPGSLIEAVKLAARLALVKSAAKA